MPGHLYSSGASLSLYTQFAQCTLHITHTVKSDSSDCRSLVGFDGKTCTSVYFDLAHFHTLAHFLLSTAHWTQVFANLYDMQCEFFEDQSIMHFLFKAT